MCIRDSLYFGLPLALGMRIPPDVAGIVAIGVNSGAYIAEIVRGAIESIDKGQMEAGRSTGLTKAQTMLYIIWPQAFRRMIPPLTNQCIISLKDTSLLVVIGVGELTRQGQEIIAVNFRAFEVWLTVALFYLCLLYTSIPLAIGQIVIAFGSGWLEGFRGGNTFIWLTGIVSLNAFISLTILFALSPIVEMAFR